MSALRKSVTKLVGVCRAFASSTAAAPPSKTALYDFHVENKGKVVDFAGYLLPVQYADLGIAASHLHTRKFASIFDVSHMLQTLVRGRDCVQAFESICTSDIRGLADNAGSLTVFTNDKSAILDDLIVTKCRDDFLYVVSNAAMKAQDMGIMEAAINKFKADGKDVSIEFLTPTDQSLIALQGPSGAAALQALTKTDLSRLFFMTTVVTEVAGVANCRITRCGYTGEDGFEISIPSEKVRHVTEALLQQENVKLAGLGARDSLRLEAGLCLYGSDIDANTTPVEGALSWLIAKRRRAEANFPGAETINNQLKSGVSRRRVGVRMLSGPPARHDVEIFAEDRKIGVVTSGCPSPSLGGNVGMGYVEEQFKAAGTKVQLKIREKFYGAEIAKMPFLPAKYFVKPKA